MKHQDPKPLLLAVAMLGFIALHARSQSAFQNLDFEAANIPPGTAPGFVPASQAIPGWSTGDLMSYDGPSLGGVVVMLSDTLSPYPGFTPLQGNYSVVLFGGENGPPSASISQTGLVPANARSIQIDVSTRFGPSSLFGIALGGQVIAMTPLRAGPGGTIYGGDISAYAGQVENLVIFEADPPPGVVPPSAVEIDDIVFSTQVVPEPATWALLVCSVGVFVSMRRCKT